MPCPRDGYVVNVALGCAAKALPVDSGYEALIAEKLVAARRRFEKPLRFDAGDDAVFPDFWLRDLCTAPHGGLGHDLYRLSSPEERKGNAL